MWVVKCHIEIKMFCFSIFFNLPWSTVFLENMGFYLVIVIITFPMNPQPAYYLL